MGLMAPIFLSLPPSLPFSLSLTHTLLSISVVPPSLGQLEPTRAVHVTSPLTGERTLGAWLACIHMSRPLAAPPPRSVTAPFSTLSPRCCVQGA